MNEKELRALAEQAAQSIRSEKDLCEFSAMLKKLTVETALNAELDDHLGYERHARTGTGNSRNGHSKKTLLSDEGELQIQVPRDRQGSFEPKLVKKHQTRLTSMDEVIHCLYAKGMTTREIVQTFKEMYDADVEERLSKYA